MEQFYTIANQYYRDFYSFKGHLKPLWKQMTLSLLTGAIFCFAILIFLGLDISWLAKLSRSLEFALMIIAEIIFIVCWFWTTESRKKRITLKLSTRLNTKASTINALKKEWLLQTFESNSTQYFEIAESFSKASELYHRNKPEFSFSKENFFDLIADESARPRILALFLSLCSIVAIILLKEGNGLEYLIKFYNGISLYLLFFADLLVALALLLTLVSLKLMFILLVSLFSSLSHSIEGRRAQSDFIAKNLIRDLVYFHKVKVAKIRIEQ